MNIRDEILSRLHSTYPGKTFGHVLKVDEISFKPRVVFTVNSRETSYGYYPELVQDGFANPLEFVDGFMLSQGKNLGAL